MASIHRRNTGYQVQVRRKGFPVSSGMFNSRKEAESWAREIESEMDRGVYHSRKEAESTTLLEALDRYEIEVTSTKKGAARERYRLAHWRKQPLACRFLASIRSTDVAQYRDDRLSQVGSTQTVRLELGLLSHVFTIAIKEWGMEGLRNPVELIRLPKRPLGRDRRTSNDREMQLDEIEAIIAATSSTQLPSIIRLAVETAMRRSEIIKLTWDQVDLQRRTITLHETKNGDRRIVPLSSRALEIIRAIPRQLHNDTVFSTTPESASTLFYRVVKRARKNYLKIMAEQGREPDPSFLVNLKFHDLRHEGTSRFFEKGLNTMEVATITGHKTLSMLMRYTHLRPESLLAKLG